MLVAWLSIILAFLLIGPRQLRIAQAHHFSKVTFLPARVVAGLEVPE
jgi:hypothetical protein